MIISKTPFRISFYGGGTDFPHFYLENGGSVISATIDKYMYITLNETYNGKTKVNYSIHEEVDDVSDIKHDIAKALLKRYNLSGVEISSISDIPSQGTGLGSSSAYCVGLLNCISTHLNLNLSKDEIAKEACFIERNICKHPIGIQDQYASTFGGLNNIIFTEENKAEVYPIDWIDYNTFQSHYFIVNTNNFRPANTILATQVKENNKEYLLTTKQIKERALDALIEKDVPLFFSYLAEAWEVKKKFTLQISNPTIDSMCNLLYKEGANGVKLLGAGGGGYILVSAPKELHNSILEKTKLKRFSTSLSFRGTEIIYDSRNSK